MAKLNNPLKKTPTTPKATQRKLTEEFLQSIEDSAIAKFEALTYEDLPAPESSDVVTSTPVLGSTLEIRRKVVDYLPLVEKIKIAMLKGQDLREAILSCKLPYNLETRKALHKAMQLDFIITHRTDPTVERMLVEAARSKFLTEAMMNGDSRQALQWATLISDDPAVFEEKKQQAVKLVDISDIADFVNASQDDEIIEAEFREVLAEEPKEGT